MTISVRNMRTPAGGAARGRAKKLGTGVLLLFGLCLGFIGFAATSGAHHPTLSASVACGPEAGTYTVTYNTGADADAETRNNPDIEVYWGLTSVTWPASAGGANPAGAVLGAEGAYNSGNSWSFGGTFNVTPGAGVTQIEVIVHANADFQGAGGGQWMSTNTTNGVPITLTLPTNCNPPNPSAVTQLVCGESKINVNFTGVGSATTVDIEKNDVLVANDFAVPVGASTYAMALVAADENTTVKIDLNYAEGSDQLNVQVPVNCKTPPAPKADVEWECGDTSVLVKLTNDGDEPATGTILKNGNPVAGLSNVAIPGNYNVPVVGGDENTTVTIAVDFSGSTETFSEQIEVDCLKPPAPKADVEWECGDTSVLVKLTNDGDEPATGTILKNGNPVAGLSNVAIPGNYNVPVVAGDENTTMTIAVDFSGSTATFSEEIEVDCDHPDPTISDPECAEGGVSVVLGNEDGKDTATFTVVVNGGSPTQESVDAGESKTITIPVAEGSSVSFTITSGDAELVVENYTRDCEDPQVLAFSLECAEGGVVVVLTNDGELDTIVTVDGTPHNVPAGAGSSEQNPAVSVTVPVDENADYDFMIVGDDLEQQVTGTADCQHPDPSVDQELDCTEGGGLTLTMRNTGDDTAFFVVTSPVLEDGAEADITTAGTTEIAVEPDEVATLNIPLEEDATTELTVTSGGTSLFDDPITRDCETVEGKVIETPPAGSLPTTGSNVRGLLGPAWMLILAGAALVFGARRREARSS